MEAKALRFIATKILNYAIKLKIFFDFFFFLIFFVVWNFENLNAFTKTIHFYSIEIEIFESKKKKQKKQKDCLKKHVISFIFFFYQ